MDSMKRFLAYYQAFEATYVDDDWSRLEALFAPDAVYRVTGSGAFDCTLTGREAVFAGIRKFLDGFDRRCTRRLESLEPPTATAEAISFRGAASYARGDSPPFRITLREIIDYRDDRIVRITDIYDWGWESGLPADAQEWLRRYGADLTLGYV
jgi:ketosteroid isomerase-like protein